jgi:DNA-binding NarL/FixJ family response regulator
MIGMKADCFRVLLVARQIIIGKALSALLTADGELDVLSDQRDVDEAMLATQRPDLLLIDLDTFDDINSIVEISKRASPHTKIVVLTSCALQLTMQRCVASGVDGYIVKDVLPAEFIRACKSVCRGETYFDPRLAGELLRRLRAGAPAMDELSIREGEIIRLIAFGLSNKEIGAQLVLAEKTVKNHITRIFSKIQVTARTQAAIYAIRNGLA